MEWVGGWTQRTKSRKETVAQAITRVCCGSNNHVPLVTANTHPLSIRNFKRIPDI